MGPLCTYGYIKVCVVAFATTSLYVAFATTTSLKYPPTHIPLSRRLSMRLGLLIAAPSRNVERIISDIESLILKYDSKLIYTMKTFEEIRLVEKKMEEL